MSSRLTKKYLSKVKWRLERMVDAHANCGVPLRDDLKTMLDETFAVFDTKRAAYDDVRAQRREAANQAAELQQQGIEALQRLKNGLKSQIPADQLDPVWQVYGLNVDIPDARLDVMATLGVVLETAGRQTDDSRKPTAELQTELQTTYDALEAKVTLGNQLKADFVEAKRDLQAVLKQATALRTRAYAYLTSVLPARSRDPKLIDYGLRQSFGGRRSTTVTVVNEEEIPAEPTQP